MNDHPARSAKRRGAQIDPPNRFDSLHHEPDEEYLQTLAESADTNERRVPTQFLPDNSKSIISPRSFWRPGESICGPIL